jgi:hypothetical protein
MAFVDIPQEDKYMTADLKEMDSTVDFAELQQLRHFQSKLVVAHSTLKATMKVLDIVEGRHAVAGRNSGASKEGTLGLKCLGFLRSTEVLQQRLQSIARLVSILMQEYLGNSH